MSRQYAPHLPLAFALAALLAACASDSTGSGSHLTIKGAAGPPPPAPPAGRTPDATPPVAVGDPSTFTVGLYALYISPNADCSSPLLVQSYGSTPVPKDMVAGPTLFSSSTTPGTYPCVALELSDVIAATTATGFGACAAGVPIYNDIYKAGEVDWKDVNLNPITGHGSDAAPVDDHVTLILTSNTAAALARGFSVNQLAPLASDLVVPGSGTMYWDGTGTVQDNGTSCDLEAPVVSFR